MDELAYNAGVSKSPPIPKGFPWARQPHWHLQWEDLGEGPKEAGRSIYKLPSNVVRPAP